MNSNEKALDILIAEIIKAMKLYCKRLCFDCTYTGTISSVNKDGYTVKYSGTEINIKTKNTQLFKKWDTVKFCIPCNNKRKAYIVVDIDTIFPSSSIMFSDNTGTFSGTTIDEVLQNVISEISSLKVSETSEEIIEE